MKDCCVPGFHRRPLPSGKGASIWRMGEGMRQNLVLRAGLDTGYW